ncbi:hypothetical protein [Crossiella sp. CA198]|uniref:hypothetical protein n=1 Tax=Crossiella sp. CA198 TaxID=3455607 RepID=UPI003F8D16EE
MPRWPALLLLAVVLVTGGCAKPPSEKYYEVKVDITGGDKSVVTLSNSTGNGTAQYTQDVTTPYTITLVPNGGPAKFTATPKDPGVAVECNVTVEGEHKVRNIGEAGKPALCELSVE